MSVCGSCRLRKAIHQHKNTFLLTYLITGSNLLKAIHKIYQTNDCYNWLLLFRTKKTVIVDVVIVNSVMWAEKVGKGWKGQESKGGEVATKQGTRVDGNSPLWAGNWPSK